jgi:large subunit ribosomal protein L24
MPAHVRKGDTVMVTSGLFKGQTAVVLRVLPKNDRVVVKGVNLRTKHVKPNRTSPQGGIIQREEPIHISKVSPVVDGKPCRVRFVIKPDGSKVRMAVRRGMPPRELNVVSPAAKK